MNQGGGIVITLVYLAIVVLMIASMWRVFAKAGKPGWAAIVPIYNFIVLLDIANKPVWWIVLLLIPVVNFIACILIYTSMAERFGKSGGFTAGLILLPFIFWPILGFGSAEYQG